MPPAIVAAPSIAGDPATGILGVGAAAIGAGVAVTITTLVGMGVAVVGQLQENSPVHWGFLQRLIP